MTIGAVYGTGRKGETMSESAPTLWHYALSRWKQPAFEKACLRLQDEAGIPISLLLFGLWLAANQRQPDAAIGRQAEALAEQFEARYLRPLRAVRRDVTTDTSMLEFKRQLQQSELEGERVLLSSLGAWFERALPAANTVTAMAWFAVLLAERYSQWQAELQALSELPEQ